MNASPITPGRSYLSSSLTFKLTDPSVFTQQQINFKRLLLNQYTGSDENFLKSFILKVHHMIWSMKSSFIYDQT